MPILKDNAPLYWQAGIPVIPLKRHDSPGKGAGKAPILSDWTAYGDNMPSPAIRESWLHSYPKSNIGLPFGAASGLCAIDIDTENEEMIAAIRKALPASPWVRVGKKGMGLIYRWNGQANFKLRDSDNQSIVEFLGRGNQMVMPPSIHPDTHKPYTSDTNLWEVLDKILPLPQDLERVLRQALGGIVGVKLAQSGRSGPVDVVPQGERDIQMVRRAGYYARVVQGIDKTEKFSLADAMRHMRTWVEEFTSHSSGDDMDPEKGVSKLIEFLARDVSAGRTMPNGWDAGLTDEQRAHPVIAEIIEKNKSQRWTVIRAADWFAGQLAMKPGDREWAMEKVTEIIEEVAKDENFTELDFGNLFNMIRPLVKDMIPLTKADCRAAFRGARKGDAEVGADHEEIARQVIDEMERGGELRFNNGQFWQWNGSCFSKVDKMDITKAVSQLVKGNVLARRQSDYEAVTKTIAMLVRRDLVEEIEIGINFANGFLDSNMELHDHAKKWGKTFTMPFNYIPERAAEAHKWLEFLEQCWGDDEDYAEKVMALQEAFAATMFGIATTYQTCFLLHGKPKTGKSQMLAVLEAMMPDDSKCSISPEEWSERFVVSGMVGKVLNVCGELPEDSVINGQIFKKVIPGETVNSEFKGMDKFDFHPICAHWFASNFLPRSRDSSGGFIRRWMIFDFNNVVTDENKIVDFWKVLRDEEREAIAAWGVQGLQRLLKQKGYTQPSSHVRLLAQTLRANNSVAAFIESSSKIRPSLDYEDSVDLREAYDAYSFHMKEVSRGLGVSMERFKGMLQDLGYSSTEEEDIIGVKHFNMHNLRAVSGLIGKK